MWPEKGKVGKSDQNRQYCYLGIFYSQLTQMFVFLVLPRSCLEKMKPKVTLMRKLYVYILYKLFVMFIVILEV